MRARTSLTALVLGTALALSPVSVASASPRGGGGSCAPGVSLLGFSDDLDGASFAGTQVAGLSALTPAGSGRALALVDNVGTTPARFYDLALPRPDTARVTKVTFLTRPDGTPYTGADFDGEGLALERGGRTILASSETEPSIRRFDRRSGRQLASLPVPDRFRVSTAGGQAIVNQTFEGLTLYGRTLYAGTEGPLSADGADASGRPLLRILRYAHDRPIAQLAYRADPGLGLAELAAVGDGTLLVLERGFTAGVGNTVRIYRVSVRTARDVTGVASLATAPDLVFLRKRLVVDIADCPPDGATAKQPQPNPLLDNIEGMTLAGPLGHGRRLLRLISDNNNSPTQTTRVYALAVRLSASPLASTAGGS